MGKIERINGRWAEKGGIKKIRRNRESEITVRVTVFDVLGNCIFSLLQGIE